MRIKPLSQRVIYQNNPLTEVVCQVRFSRVDLSADAVETFWLGLDKSEYRLRFDEDVSTVQLHFGPQTTKLDSTEVVEKIHNFISMDRAWKVTLTNDFLALSCSKYETWDEYSKRLNLALQRLISTIGNPSIERVGLRYRDIIDRAKLGLDGVAWTELLQPYVLGPFAALEISDDGAAVAESDVLAHNFQTVLRLDSCQMLLQGGIVYSQEGNRQAMMIDTDFFLEGDAARVAVKSFSDLDNLLQQLHKDAGAMFRALIRERLHDALRPNPVEHA